MKVKDLIAELSKLDQEKGIWGLYDHFCLFELMPDDEADEDDVANFRRSGMKVGDYIVNAW
jgi:hypothetical protein